MGKVEGAAGKIVVDGEGDHRDVGAIAHEHAFTFLGAVLFFVGAALLLPDMTRMSEPAASPSQGR